MAIEPNDNYRFREISTELIDLLRDHVCGFSLHVQMIADSYNGGISNFSHSPSFACVKEFAGVVSTVVTRLERNPTLFNETIRSLGTGPDKRKLLEALDQIMMRFRSVVVSYVSCMTRKAALPTG